MQALLESDYQKKVISVSFQDETLLDSAQQVRDWRQQWMEVLGTWHSPYKVVMDCQNLKIVESDEVVKELEQLLAFLRGFFMRSLVAFNYHQPSEGSRLPFEVVSEEEAEKRSGIHRKRRGGGDFRSSIFLENRFRQHVVELGFESQVLIETSDQVNVFKDKLINNMMLWHSPWSLLIDCQNLQVSDAVMEEFARVFQYFRAFYLKSVVGYGAGQDFASLPFKVFRSRHKAAAQLEGEGMVAGNDAHCQSKR